jgi:hypothetical protein
MDNQEEIKRLTALWFEIVSLDHHKDKDCHWYITEQWSYGDYPTYHVEHYGYVLDDISRETDTREKAEIVLIGLIKDAISKQKKWAERVLRNPDDEDKCNIENAKSIIELTKAE